MRYAVEVILFGCYPVRGIDDLLAVEVVDEGEQETDGDGGKLM